jgi:hypothetical protein
MLTDSHAARRITDEMVALPLLASDDSYRIIAHRFQGCADGPNVYIQAGIHGAELPAILVALHVVESLAGLSNADAIRGDVTIVASSNPIALNQHFFGEMVGRFSVADGRNFNRCFPDLSDSFGAWLEAQHRPPALSDIRACLRALLAREKPETVAEGMKLQLMRLAIEHEICLDFHCDGESVLHAYVPDHARSVTDRLAQSLGLVAMLTGSAHNSGSFDDTINGLWSLLLARHGSSPSAFRRLVAATVEFRGRGDFDPLLAAQDAGNVISFLRDIGTLEGAASAPPSKAKATCSPLVGVDWGHAPVAGLLAFNYEVGNQVSKGDVVARILDPSGRKPMSEAAPVHARTSGLLFSRSHLRLARAGDVIFKIAGAEALPQNENPGALLEL